MTEQPCDYSKLFFEAIRTRRVSRRFTSEPVAERDIWLVLEAARRAASGGNVRLHRYLVIRDPRRLRLLRMVSPGMLAVPQALIVICTDLEVAAAAEVQVDRHDTILVDVGTAAMNMMLAAQALGLGSCPATSFSRPAVVEILELPAHARPEFMLQLGHPAPEERILPPGPKKRVTAADLAYWERYGERREPEAGPS